MGGAEWGVAGGTFNIHTNVRGNYNRHPVLLSSSDADVYREVFASRVVFWSTRIAVWRHDIVRGAPPHPYNNTDFYRYARSAF